MNRLPKKIIDHCKKFENKNQLLKKLSVPHKGNFVSPAVIKVNGIADLEKNLRPVLHVANLLTRKISTR